MNLTFNDHDRDDKVIHVIVTHVWPTEPLHIVIDQPPPPPPPTATKAVLTTSGDTPMGASFNVDEVNQTVSIAYEDDHGDLTAPPVGATVVFASDNTASASVGDPASTANGFTAPITLGVVGSGNFTVTQTGAFEADGTTPIPDPAPEPFNVVAGAANQVVLSTTGDVPPAPPAPPVA